MQLLLSCHTAGLLTCVMVALFTFNLQTKFDMSSFISSKDMVLAPKNVEIGHVTLTTPTWGIISRHKANTSRGQFV